VQHLDGGIVQAIHVKAGDKVTTDKILVLLDDTTLAPDFKIYGRRLRNAIVLRERLGAELDGKAELSPPLELARLLKLNDLSASAAQQKSTLEARRLTRESQIAQLDEKIAHIENQWWHALHLNLRRVLISNASSEPQRGQTGAQSVVGQRILRKRS
jgi:multidrug efflux pump subunit AcrA (membrane-fusion protein)